MLLEILHASNRQKSKNGIVGAFGNEETSKSAENTERKDKQNISEGIENEKAFQFLWNLNYSTDNYITVFNEYEAYFLNSKPKMNIDGIKRLLLGDKALRGLMNHSRVCARSRHLFRPSPQGRDANASVRGGHARVTGWNGTSAAPKNDQDHEVSIVTREWV